MKRAACLTLFATLVIPLRAQVEEDPREKMQEIMERVADEMKQIDAWLNQSSKTPDKGKRLEKLLENTGKTQQSVVKGIEELLKEAQKLKGDGD